MNRCYCPLTHQPDGVHCRWLTTQDRICLRCQAGRHSDQPAPPTGRHPEQPQEKPAHA